MAAGHRKSAWQRFKTSRIGKKVRLLLEDAFLVALVLAILSGIHYLTHNLPGLSQWFRDTFSRMHELATLGYSLAFMVRSAITLFLKV